MKREYWKYLPFVFPYALRHKGHLVASFLVMVLGAGAALLEPLPLAFLVDSVLGDRRPPEWIVAMAGTTPSRLIMFTVVASLLVVLLMNALGMADSYVNTKLEQRIALDLRYDLFQHCLRLSRAFHDITSPGDYIYRINYEAHAAGAITVAFAPLFQSVLTLFGMFYVTYRLAPALALLSLAVVPFIYYSTGMYGRVIEPRLIRARELEGESLSIVNRTMSFLRVIIAFNRQPHELRRFREQGEAAVHMRIRVTVAQTFFNLGVAVITAAGSAMIIGVGAYYVLNQRITVGQLLIVISYIAAIYQPLQTISGTMAQFQDHLIGIRFGKAMLEMAPEVVDTPDAIELDHVEGAVEFEDVSFHYETRTETLNNVSFSVNAGETVAIVGPTGAGKSTLVSLIPRFFDPHEGTIRVDGHDLRSIKQRSLRAHVALVSQEGQLFAGTVWENIRYGRLDATDEEVIAAATAANAHDFVLGLPQGYDTDLGDQGARLSGGERQRICIARAFLKDAPILILDEPTSAVDSKTEWVILEALERLQRGRTTFTIAHRLSTVRNVDRILVLSNGRLVEHGTHDELLRLDGLYGQLHRIQTLGYTADADVAAAPAPEAIHAASTADASPPPLTVVSSPVPTSSARPADVALRTRPKIVVLGLMSRLPVAGVVWQTVHYLVGLQRLGFDVYYVESHAAIPSMLMQSPNDDAAAAAARFIHHALRPFGLANKWAFQALHGDGRCYGMSYGELQALFRSAAGVINLHGGTQPLPEHAGAGPFIYLQTDPGALQVELDQQLPETIAFLEPHTSFFTYGENIGTGRSPLPQDPRFPFLPTRQPVLCDLWHGGVGADSSRPAQRFTTIGNWRQDGREVWFRGRVYHWSKHREFQKVLDLPTRTGVELELAMGKVTDEDRDLLRRHGWRVADSLAFSTDVNDYRDYVRASRGEFTVAKDQNVRLRTGWFSDRSATYLAAGLPVITQETGFSDVLPTGEGLFAFSDADEAAAGLDKVQSDYARHRGAAAEIAREYFSYDRVLPPLLTAAGVEMPSGSSGRVTPPTLALPSTTSLRTISRHPTTLDESTVETLQAMPWPRERSARRPRPEEPTVSIVMVTYGGLSFTRLCVESLLTNTAYQAYELVVVDNASTDGTVSYLQHVETTFDHVRVVFNTENVGFAPAANQGIAMSAGEVIVLLNNDTIVPPGWLDRLVAHVQDPAIGMVGAMTNGARNEARVETDYATYAEFLRFAGRFSAQQPAQVFDIPVATMFCVALRRTTFDQVGPLDERFAPGMFEDDDYAVRLRTASLRVVCARDVYVHHFGEASFGHLVPSGEYGEVFRTNRARFEEKWHIAWQTPKQPTGSDYMLLRDQVRSAIQGHVPAGSTVLVVSRGDDELLTVEDRHARHFPQNDDGHYAGYHPGTASEAIDQLEQLRQGGAQYVVFPATAMWWLDHYSELRAHLEDTYGTVTRDDACLIYGPAS